MTGFSFDNTSSFEANLDAFLQYMKQEDTELGAILADEASRLNGAVDEGRRKAARTDFNSAVRTGLDKKLAEKKTGGSK